MGDAWGTICIPVHENLERFHPDLLVEVSENFKTELFSIYGFRPSVLNQRYFQLKNSLLVGRFLCLKVEDIGWSDLCRHIIDENPDSELYATLYSEYGQRFFYASNGQGERFSFSFEDDGDERDQEDFDPTAFETQLSDGEKRWLGLLDDELKGTCPPLLTYLRGRRFEDGDFNWDRYEPGRHDGKLEDLQESLRGLHSSLSTRTLESCLQFMAEAAGKPPTHPKMVKWAQAFFEEDLEDFLLVLEACLGRAPVSFFGEWEYGFDFSGEEDLADSVPEDLMKLRFVFKDDLGRFTLLTR